MKKILRALAFLGAVFSVFMLALLRVFLDPKLYGPGVQSRFQHLANPMPVQIYNSEIPEAVSNGIPAYPEATPMPGYAPAAYVPEGSEPAAYEPEVHVPTTYGGGGMSYDQASAQQAYEPSPYGEPAPVEMEMPATPQVYADGSYGGDSPYVSASAQPYGSVGQSSAYAGPEGNIPVLGATDVKPYT